MLKRLAQDRLRRLASGFPVLVLTGPRQSGKTSLAQATFPEYAYVSLEDLDVRERALADPRGFLAQHNQGVIIDEVQRAPQVLSYLQTQVDRERRMGRYVLTGSENLLLSAHVSQSLAGRAGYLELLPFAYCEIESIMRDRDLAHAVVCGSYPALFDRAVSHTDWLSSYVSSYVERDVRQLSRVADLQQFQRFMKMAAARCGQLLNLNELAHSLGIAQTTARDWLNVLEASYITYRLPPHSANFGKRIVKTPKLYFHDTGLCSHLLGLNDPAQFATHPMRGALFENYLINEYGKYSRNFGRNAQCFFWRDSLGLEVDLLVERNGVLWPIEFKSGATFQSEWLRPLRAWEALVDSRGDASQRGPAMLVSSAPGSYWRANDMIANWRDAVAQLGQDHP